MSDRAADLRVFDEGGGPVRGWLQDLDDLLGSVAVAGLAWPDADLGSDLEALAERGVVLGVVRGAERLRAFGVAAHSVREAPQGPERVAAETSAFDGLMQLISWTRRFRTEADLLAVQAALVVRGTSEGGPPGRRGAVASLTVGVVGMELSGERLVIHGVGLEDGAPVVLMDRLVELDDADPVARPAISRLFQARVTLGEVLRGVVLLTDHPVSRQGDVALFRPAFDAAARLLPLEVGQAPVDPAELGWAEGEPSWPAHGLPARTPVRIGRQGERIAVELGDRVLPLPETAVLRFTATKAALVAGGLAEVGAVLRCRKQVHGLLAVDGPQGRCLPQLDPRAFALDPGALAAATEIGTPAGMWARAALRRAQGAEDGELAAAIAGSAPQTVREAWFVARAARVLSVPIPAVAPGTAGGVLVDPLASSEDRWRAVWILLSADRVDAHLVALNALWERCYEPPPPDPTPADLCARAVLMDLLGVGATEEVDASTRALGYLDAHLAALRLSARSHQPLLPSLEALCWLAEARLILTGDGGRAPLALLDLPADRLRLLAIDALWKVYGPEPTGPVEEAGDAVWAMGLAGWAAQLFG